VKRGRSVKETLPGVPDAAGMTLFVWASSGKSKNAPLPSRRFAGHATVSLQENEYRAIVRTTSSEPTMSSSRNEDGVTRTELSATSTKSILTAKLKRGKHKRAAPEDKLKMRKRFYLAMPFYEPLAIEGDIIQQKVEDEIDRLIVAGIQDDNL